jgi:hypothetical protein
MTEGQLGVEHTDAPGFGEHGCLDREEVAEVPSLQLLNAEFHVDDGLRRK